MIKVMVKSFLPTVEGLTKIDEWLRPHADKIQKRLYYTREYERRILDGSSVEDFALGHLYFGLHRTDDGWIYRDWAPNATKIYIVGDFSSWKDIEGFKLSQLDGGKWEINLPRGALDHLSKFKLHVYWDGGHGYRVPAWSRYVIQDESTKQFDAVVWDPPKEFAWTDDKFKPNGDKPLIYEAHVGMSSEDEAVSTYRDFARSILPKIKTAGYNTVQLMAIAEHPYYGSFGYHVSSFFAPSSRFGTPDDLKYLVNKAHSLGLKVIMDIVHSHAVKNEAEGISRYDGSLNQYFHPGDRGNHSQWDSRVFDYGKPEVAHFLLSNCRYWLDEFHIDGYRFDGVTSMLYTHHGMGVDFDNYAKYFKNVDKDALAYLTLANQLIHTVRPGVVTIAEDMSGMPGLALPISDGGLGFDYRLDMGVPDLWIKYTKDLPDDKWSVNELYSELSQHRPSEASISYAESHDQALVGDKTLIFRLADKSMYTHMQKTDDNIVIDRAVALHKMIRLLTASLNNGGYLNFMGNEFGHPEWIDFPRGGNDWSYKYARRQWSLLADRKLRYHQLSDFDRAMLILLDTATGDPELITAHEADHVLAFRRGRFVFVFNFHPTQSYTGYGIAAAKGKYKIVLSSDAKGYGGFNRISTDIDYVSDGQLKLYLPARTACVLYK